MVCILLTLVLEGVVVVESPLVVFERDEARSNASVEVSCAGEIRVVPLESSLGVKCGSKVIVVSSKERV